MIKDVVRLNSLYDYYGDLLSENQRMSFYYYYILDYSLTEISEEIGISKQGISENLKRATKELENYESVLNLFNKNDKIRNSIEDMKNIIKDLNKEDKIKMEVLIQDIVKELDD